MKILFDHHSPFFLAHGGFQTQIEQTKYALEQIGVEVESVCWWDDRQTGDLVHFFGTAPLGYIHSARSKALPVVMTSLFTATCNRSPRQLRLQGRIVQTLLAIPGWWMIRQQLSWDCFRQVRCNVVGLEAERNVLRTVYAVPDERIAIVPLGLPAAFACAGPGKRSQPYLISTGTIAVRKRCVELAELAHQAQVPILFVGKPYSYSDPYWLRFQKLIDGQIVQHQDHVGDVSELICLLQDARGFVTYTSQENWCLAAHEAAACGLPLLVTDQNWSRERFGNEASYLRDGDETENVGILRDFYKSSEIMPPPTIVQPTWNDAALTLRDLYSRILSSERR